MKHMLSLAVLFLGWLSTTPVLAKESVKFTAWTNCVVTFRDSDKAYVAAVEEKEASLGDGDEPLTVGFCRVMLQSEMQIASLGIFCVKLGTNLLKSGSAHPRAVASTDKAVGEQVTNYIRLLQEQLATCNQLPGAPPDWFK